ncbi:MAG: class I SAM-dependent methyltransferase [Geobacteraceae bacterium]|nr:class I SAM-dependent methyltransferase [Geobacteraceae bacterium]
MDVPRDITKLERFLDKLASDVYPELPSIIHTEITNEALKKLEDFFPLTVGKKVLDVGCGQGPALEFFHNHHADYLGVTLGDDDIAACRAKGYKVEKMDQSFLAIPDNSQDLLWARHVIEHSIFPLFTLHEFYRVLRPGGMLYVEVPAPETACHHECNPNHYSVLTKGSWHSLIERSGFRILCIADYAFVVPAGPDTYWGFYCKKL